MFIRRGVFGAMFLLGMGVLLGALLSSEAAGSLVAAPLVALAFLFKVAFFILFLGFVARAFGSGTGRRGWHGAASGRWAATRRHEQHAARSGGQDGPDAVDRFEEWHRMAHARQEVDESVPPVVD